MSVTSSREIMQVDMTDTAMPNRATRIKTCSEEAKDISIHNPLNFGGHQHGRNQDNNNGYGFVKDSIRSEENANGIMGTTV